MSKRKTHKARHDTLTAVNASLCGILFADSTSTAWEDVECKKCLKRKPTHSADNGGSK